MRKGRRLAVDVGKTRVGLAISDQDGILATPFATVQRQESLVESARVIAEQVADYDFLEIYVGLPVSLSGASTPSTQDAVNLAYSLSRLFETEVRFIDERLTTVSAGANLRLAGKTAKSSRGVIDQEAAAIILEQALNAEKSSSNVPGQPLASQVEDLDA